MLSSLLGGVLNGDTLSPAAGTSGSRLTFPATNTGFVGILGLSARFTGGGRLLFMFSTGLSSMLLRAGWELILLFSLSATKRRGEDAIVWG